MPTNAFQARADVQITLPADGNKWVSSSAPNCAFIGLTAYCNVESLPVTAGANAKGYAPGGIDLSSDEPGPTAQPLSGPVSSYITSDGVLDLAALAPAVTTTEGMVALSASGGQVAVCSFAVTAGRDGNRANGYFGIQCTVPANMDGDFYWYDSDTDQVFKSGYKGPVYNKTSQYWTNSTYKGHPGHRMLLWCGSAYTRYGATGPCVTINHPV